MAGVSDHGDATIMLDTSGDWGFGAFSSGGDWFQLRWPSSWMKLHIMVKELLLLAISMAMWGSKWRGRRVKCRCDSVVVVTIISLGSSKDTHAMHLMTSSFFFLASYDVSIWGEHSGSEE